MTAKSRDGEDPVWDRLHDEVADIAHREPMLASYLQATVLNHASLEDALSYLLASKLASAHFAAMSLRDVIQEALGGAPEVREAIRADLTAVLDRDPAARGLAQPFLHYKGFHALESYRIAHWLWEQGREPLAYYLQNRISEMFAVDIHPAARIGKGILIDHGTSVVIGETAVVGDDVSMLHEVTLGGTGKESGDRHPKVGNGVLIGAGAKILGNVKIGDWSKVASGSVVLKEVPAHATVAGVPARVVGKPTAEEPALIMDQVFEENGKGCSDCPR
ncbi:serine O-acetyltransferase [Geomesophilobacter sediminis]|uniref:Serine acetyltransferase n=1 Tax=Geomesophilobacter sediminis TaxID=2798584 RepID=A0A8J7LUP2_9BACT|nr:serine O-acetyltransferase [Geomesophilobacter sediminis]MBJ6723955.1 serine O-acetyltransferase [Geomesophilobacter sediminis]